MSILSLLQLKFLSFYISRRLLESKTNNGSGDIEVKTCTETNAQDKNIKPRKTNQYEQIKLDIIAEEVCQQGCPACYIEKFFNLEEYSNHIKQKSHIKVKKLARKRSDSIIKDLIYDNSGPNTESGLEFIHKVEGYYCQLCQLIFCEEMEAKVNHCKTDTHIILFKNLIDNSDAIEKALADAMIKTQNKNLNETENVTRPCSSSLIDSNLSQDIRDLCLDKLEEVLAEKEQISLSKSKECNSVMFTECSDLEKGFFTEQEVKGNIPFEFCPSVKDSRTLVKKTNISLDTMTEIEDVPTYLNLSTSANVKTTESLKNSSISNKMDISLPYILSNTANSQNDMKLKYYGLFPNQKKLINDSSSNSDEEEALTNIKDKVPIEDLTTVSQNSTWSLQQCVPSSALNNHIGILHQSTNEEKSMKTNDTKCTQHQSKTSIEKVSKSNMDEINEAEASNSSKDESLNSDDYDTDSDSVVSSDTYISNRSTNNVIRESITNSCLPEAEISQADDLNELDTTIKEDLLCYKCLQEFEKTVNLNPAESTAVKTDIDKAESCSANHVLGHHGKECTNQISIEDKELSNISISGCLMENYYICQDGLGHKNTLGNDRSETSTQICDISLYSDCDKPDDKPIIGEHVKNIKSASNDSDIKFSGCTKYSISVQKDLDLLNSDLDLLPSTSFNYSTALDFDINSNTLEHNDFEVDGFDVHEEIFCRNIMTQTYSMVTSYDSRYMGDKDYLVSEKIEVQNSEREPPDGIEDKKHTLQVYNTSENKCFVPNILSQDVNRAEDLIRNKLSDSTTLVDCEALIHFIDSVIGEQQQTTEMMIDSYNQPLDNSAEEDCDKLDLACRANENLNVIITFSHDDIEGDQVSGEKPDHQCDVSNEDMLPAFSENKDDSGITDDYDEGFVCLRNSPQLRTRLISKGNHISSNNLDKDKTINASLDKCDTAEWISSQEPPSLGFSSVGTKIDTMDNVCFDDQNRKEMEAERTFFQTQSADNIEGCGEDSTVVEKKDPFVEETDIIIQVRNCNITVDTNETLSIDICEDTTIETTFLENQEF